MNINEIVEKNNHISYVNLILKFVYV